MGFFDFLTGGGDEDESTRETIQRSRIPEEISPYATDLLQDAQKLYRERLAAGVPVYDAPRIAPLTPDQLASQAGLRGLVGTSRPLQDEALGLYRGGTEEFVELSPADLETYMSPYQRSVTDIEKRKAQDVFTSDIMPRFEKRAADAGGMSGLGTRAGIGAGQLQEAYMQQQGDIEARGLQSAYRDAQNLYKEGQARKRLAATDIAGAAPKRFASGLSEQGLLKTIGGEEQALGQRALDQAYARFKEEQDYPQQQLADYSKFVYGNPLMAQRDVKTITPKMPSTTGTDLMSLGSGAFNMWGRGGGGTEKGFNIPQLFGTGAEGGGIASLPVVARQNGSRMTYTNAPERDNDDRGAIPLRITSPPPSAARSAPPPAEKPLTPSEQRKALFRKREEAREAGAGRRTGIDWATLQKVFAGADPRKSPLHAIAGAFAAEGEAVKQKGVKAAEEKAKLLDKQLTSELALLAAQEKAEALLKAARAKAGIGKGKAFTGTWKEVKSSIASKYGYALDEHGTIKVKPDQFLDTKSKGYIDYQEDLKIANTEFLKFLAEAGDESYRTQVLASRHAFKKVEETRAKRKGGTEPQTHPEYPNAKKAPDDKWYIRDPNNPKGWARVPSPK